MQNGEISGNMLIVIEHYGLVPAVSVSVRLSRTCGVQQIAVAVKSKQLFIELYRNLDLQRQIILKSESDIFVPSSCTNLCGNGIDLLLNCSKLHDFVLKVVEVESGDIPCSGESLPGVEASKSDQPRKCDDDDEYLLEFSFRIQSCSNPYALSNAFIVDTESSPKGSSPNELVNTVYNADVEENVQYSIFCGSCKQALTQSPAVFKKIVFLPSNWSEVAESWFCHAHNGDVPHTSSVRTNELYVTDVYYLLSKSTLDSTFCELKSHRLKCDTCYAMVGSTKQAVQQFNGETVQCFKDLLVFKSEKQKPNVLCDSLSKSRRAVLFISALIRKNMQASFTCKFCFESKKSSSEGMCLFLWILDRRIRRFHLQKDLSTTVKCQEELKTEETLKVLYNSAEQASPLARNWLHDFSVDVYEISDSMMKNLHDALRQSSKTVLQSQKLLNGLFVGFLPI